MLKTTRRINIDTSPAFNFQLIDFGLKEWTKRGINQQFPFGESTHKRDENSFLKASQNSQRIFKIRAMSHGSRKNIFYLVDIQMQTQSVGGKRNV